MIWRSGVPMAHDSWGAVVASVASMLALMVSGVVMVIAP